MIDQDKALASTTGETVVLASRVPPEIKEIVEKFGKATKRTASQSVHYLLSTHPELKHWCENQSIKHLSNEAEISLI